MRNIFFIMLFLSVVFIFPDVTLSDERYTTCDACGYCVVPTVSPASDPKPTSLPGNWLKCRECLYPATTQTPVEQKQTLLIQDGNIPPTVYPGRQYTMLGCVKSSINADSFIQEGPARGLTDILLSSIFSVVGGLAFLYFIYGTFLLATSQAEPERLSQGKGVVYGAIVGLIFAVSAILIIRFLASGILKIPGIQ